jgi:hypothetical protein
LTPIKNHLLSETSVGLLAEFDFTGQKHDFARYPRSASVDEVLKAEPGWDDFWKNPASTDGKKKKSKNLPIEIEDETLVGPENLEETKPGHGWGTWGDGWGAAASKKDKKGNLREVIEGPPPAPTPPPINFEEPEASGPPNTVEYTEPAFFDFSEKNKVRGREWAVEEEPARTEVPVEEETTVLEEYGFSSEYSQRKKDKKKKGVAFCADDEAPMEYNEEPPMAEEPAVMEAQEVPLAEETTLPEEEMFNLGSSKNKKDKKKKGPATWTEEHMPAEPVEEHGKADVPAAEEALHSEEDFGWRRSKKDKKRKGKGIASWLEGEGPAPPPEEPGPSVVEELPVVSKKDKKKKKGLADYPQVEEYVEEPKAANDFFELFGPASKSRKNKTKRAKQVEKMDELQIGKVGDVVCSEMGDDTREDMQFSFVPFRT